MKIIGNFIKIDESCINWIMCWVWKDKGKFIKIEKRNRKLPLSKLLLRRNKIPFKRKAVGESPMPWVLFQQAYLRHGTALCVFWMRVPESSYFLCFQTNDKKLTEWIIFLTYRMICIDIPKEIQSTILMKQITRKYVSPDRVRRVCYFLSFFAVHTLALCLSHGMTFEM